MILKSMAYSVAQCQECQSLLVYKIHEGFPVACQKCGVRGDMELTQDQRMQMERMQQQGPQVHTIRF